MANYTIQHDRPNCIGCGSCEAVCPKFWKMMADGKSDLLAAKTQDNGIQERKISEEDLACNKEAAEICPVDIIHIINNSE